MSNKKIWFFSERHDSFLEKTKKELEKCDAQCKILGRNFLFGSAILTTIYITHKKTDPFSKSFTKVLPLLVGINAFDTIRALFI